MALISVEHVDVREGDNYPIEVYILVKSNLESKTLNRTAEHRDMYVGRYLGRQLQQQQRPNLPPVT